MDLYCTTFMNIYEEWKLFWSINNTIHTIYLGLLICVHIDLLGWSCCTGQAFH